MIFLSVQPDTIYFVWQVELQLFNLQQKNWPVRGIHVLFAYSEESGINQEAKSLCDKFPNSPIFFILTRVKIRSMLVRYVLTFCKSISLNFQI